MTGARLPGFTAEESLGIFVQDYHLARTARDSIGIIHAQATIGGSQMMPSRGCCCREGVCGCERPCNGWGTPDRCGCSTT